MSTDQILKQTRENLWKYFAYRPTEKKKGNYFLQKVSGAFQSFGKVSATYVRARNYDDQNTFFDGKSGIMERGRHYIFQLSLQRNPEETKRYVEACFGKSIYSQEYQEKIEQKLCVGNHKNCHLLLDVYKRQIVSCWMYVIGMGAAIITGEYDIAQIMLKAGLGDVYKRQE